MELAKHDPNTLVAHEKNSRIHDANQIDKIASSIQEFGFLSPVVIDKDKTIIAGHGRVTAAIKLGLDKIPCVEANDLTPEQIRAFIIADNRIPELGSWDNNLLFDEINALMDLEFDIESMGIDDSFIDRLSPDMNDFQPMLDPQQQNRDVTEDDMEKQQGHIEKSFKDRDNQNLADVICPHCAEEFSVDLKSMQRNS